MSNASKYQRAEHLKNTQFTHEEFLVRRIIRYKFQLQAKFCQHDICQKASRKLNKLARLGPYMTPSKKTYSNECFLQVAI